MRFATEDQGEVIHGIIAVVHEHLDIIQDAGVKILGLINCQEQWLPLFLIPVKRVNKARLRSKGNSDSARKRGERYRRDYPQVY